MNQAQRLISRMTNANSLVCTGLDPDFDKLPNKLKKPWKSKEQTTLSFLKRVIDLTAEHSCAYKAQKAFFDALPKGRSVLKKVIRYSHLRYPDIPVFIDCKIGDIDNTMHAYLHCLFDDLNADGIVVNPYMGDDVFAELGAYADKAIIVLVQTSNPNAKVVQDYEGLWKHVLGLVVNRWNINRNLIPVIASTSPDDLHFVRDIIPDDMPILFAGVGAQGGTLDNLPQLLNSARLGVMVNSSRGILYPYQADDKLWAQKVENAVIRLQHQLNETRRP